jgi:hypothetical protein
MNIDPNKLDVTINSEDQRFEAFIGDEIVFIDYRRARNRLTLLHTDVPPTLEGHGIGSAMVKAALEYAKAEHLEILPICPFVKGYLRKHPEYMPLVSKNYRTGL